MTNKYDFLDERSRFKDKPVTFKNVLQVIGLAILTVAAIYSFLCVAGAIQCSTGERCYYQTQTN